MFAMTAEVARLTDCEDQSIVVSSSDERSHVHEAISIGGSKCCLHSHAP